MDGYIFKDMVYSDYGILAPNLWHDHFKMFELHEIMRQRESKLFAEMLNRLREGNHIMQDILKFKERITGANSCHCLILFSDHLALLFKLKTARPPLKVDCVSFRKLRSIDKDAFMDDICNSKLFQMNTDDPDELAALFDNTLHSLLDRHAPVKHKNITIRTCVPWRTDKIILAKRQRRKAERKWRASQVHIDLLSYRTMRNRVTFLMNKARSDYYTSFIIENSTDQRLFRASKSLLNLSKGSSLPLSTNDYQLAMILENSSPKKLLISGLLLQTRSACLLLSTQLVL